MWRLPTRMRTRVEAVGGPAEAWCLAPTPAYLEARAAPLRASWRARRGIVQTLTLAETQAAPQATTAASAFALSSAIRYTAARDSLTSRATAVGDQSMPSSSTTRCSSSAP